MPASLTRANTARAARAAERNRALAAEALYRLPGCPPGWADIARARIDCADATWADIGHLLGQSKNQVASRWRRLLAAAGLLGEGGSGDE